MSETPKQLVEFIATIGKNTYDIHEEDAFRIAKAMHEYSNEDIMLVWKVLQRNIELLFATHKYIENLMIHVASAEPIYPRPTWEETLQYVELHYAYCM